MSNQTASTTMTKKRSIDNALHHGRTSFRKEFIDVSEKIAKSGTSEAMKIHYFEVLKELVNKSQELWKSTGNKSTSSWIEFLFSSKECKDVYVENYINYTHGKGKASYASNIMNRNNENADDCNAINNNVSVLLENISDSNGNSGVNSNSNGSTTNVATDTTDTVTDSGVANTFFENSTIESDGITIGAPDDNFREDQQVQQSDTGTVNLKDDHAPEPYDANRQDSRLTPPSRIELIVPSYSHPSQWQGQRSLYDADCIDFILHGKTLEPNRNHPGKIVIEHNGLRVAIPEMDLDSIRKRLCIVYDTNVKTHSEKIDNFLNHPHAPPRPKVENFKDPAECEKAQLNHDSYHRARKAIAVKIVELDKFKGLTGVEFSVDEVAYHYTMSKEFMKRHKWTFEEYKYDTDSEIHRLRNNLRDKEAENCKLKRQRSMRDDDYNGERNSEKKTQRNNNSSVNSSVGAFDYDQGHQQSGGRRVRQRCSCDGSNFQNDGQENRSQLGNFRSSFSSNHRHR